MRFWIPILREERFESMKSIILNPPLYYSNHLNFSDSPLLYSGNRPYLVWGMMTSHLLRGLGLSRRWRLDVGEQKQGTDM